MLPDPADLPRAALGAAHRLDAVRHRTSPTAGRCRSTRAMSTASALTTLADAGYEFIAGLEVEFHLFKLEKTKLALGDAGQPGQPGAPPEVVAAQPGLPVPDRAALRRDGSDPGDPAHQHRRPRPAAALARGRVRAEPGRVHLPRRHGLEPADAMVLFRSAAKQVAQRNGYHATFMCRPQAAQRHVERLASAPVAQGRKTGANAFMPIPSEPLSPLGMQWMAGLLDHARAAAAFSTPTLNGYKRYRPFSLAPDRADLGPRQSRRHGARAGRTGRSGERIWRTGSASRPPIPTFIWRARS